MLAICAHPGLWAQGPTFPAKVSTAAGPQIENGSRVLDEGSVRVAIPDQGEVRDQVPVRSAPLPHGEGARRMHLHHSEKMWDEARAIARCILAARA